MIYTIRACMYSMLQTQPKHSRRCHAAAMHPP
jgi:hypothetical protein